MVPLDPDAALPSPEEEPPIWREVRIAIHPSVLARLRLLAHASVQISRFLAAPRKPAILAIARPDPKKNIISLIRAFGSSFLRDLANLVIFAGNRDSLAALSSTGRSVMQEILSVTDELDLWGSVAFPKHHQQHEKGAMFAFAAATKGVFANVALTEGFGLVFIEAAAHGVPTVGTRNGGPAEIHRQLDNGLLVNPECTSESASRWCTQQRSSMAG